MNNPLISVLIPSYLRPGDLRVTLDKTRQQSYRPFEIIVIDDGTPDDTIMDAVAAFPGVTYIKTPKNLGLIGARNFGAAHCKGQFIVNLDDDSWLEEEDDLAKIADFMRSHPRCGVIALNIGLDKVGYQWPREASSEYLRTYKGCGNVYRREIIGFVGDYISDFRRQGEEVERSLRILDAGYDIMSCPAVRVFHAQSPINRNMKHHISMEAVNYLRRELIRTPLWLLPLGILRALWWAVAHHSEMDLKFYFKEVFGDRVPLLSFIKRHRAPVRTATYFRALRLI